MKKPKIYTRVQLQILIKLLSAIYPPLEKPYLISKMSAEESGKYIREQRQITILKNVLKFLDENPQEKYASIKPHSPCYKYAPQWPTQCAKH